MSVSFQKSNKTVSEIWNYFSKTQTRGEAVCNYCKKKLQYQSTSNLKRHFVRKHGYKIGEIYDDKEIIEDFGEVVEYEVEDSIREDNDNEEPEVVTPSFVKKTPIKYASLHKPMKNKSVVQIKPSSHKSNNIEMIQEAINILNNVTRTNSIVDSGDEYSQFGKFVADQLRELPVLNALQLQEKIYCLVTRERITVMRNNSEMQSSVLKSFIQHCPEQQEECVDENSTQSALQNDKSEETVTIIDARSLHDM